MNISPEPTRVDGSLHPSADAVITRREAIRRAAVFLGVAISPSMLEGLVHAQLAGTRAGAGPVHLSTNHFAIARAAADRIIPRTDTPGALEVGVPEFIDLMAGRYLTEEEKGVFLAGLEGLEAASVAAYGRGFAAATPEQQDGVLQRAADVSQNKEMTFFFQIKELTVIGYFTAEPIGRQVLRYDPIPGRFDGCIPVSEVGKATWTPLR